MMGQMRSKATNTNALSSTTAADDDDDDDGDAKKSSSRPLLAGGGCRIAVAEIVDHILHFVYASDLRSVWLTGGIWHDRAKRRLWSGGEHLPRAVRGLRSGESTERRILRIVLRSTTMPGIYGNLGMVAILDFRKDGGEWGHRSEVESDDYSDDSRDSNTSLSETIAPRVAAMVDLALHCRSLRTLIVEDSWGVPDVARVMERCPLVQNLKIVRGRTDGSQLRCRRGYAMFGSLRNLHADPGFVLSDSWHESVPEIVNACAQHLESLTLSTCTRAVSTTTRLTNSNWPALKRVKLLARIQLPDHVDNLMRVAELFKTSEAATSVEVVVQTDSKDVAKMLGSSLSAIDNLSKVSFVYERESYRSFSLDSVCDALVPLKAPANTGFEFSAVDLSAQVFMKLSPHVRRISGLEILKLLDVPLDFISSMRLECVSLNLSSEKAEEYLWSRFREIFEIWRASRCVSRVVVVDEIEDGVFKGSRLERFRKSMSGFRSVLKEDRLTLLLW